MYIGNTTGIIDWLKKEGVKTQKQAVDKLRETAKDIFNGILINGGGNFRDKGAGVANVMRAVQENFKK